MVLLGALASLSEEIRTSVEQLALPVPDLAGMDGEASRQGGRGFVALEGFEGNFGFELGGAFFPFRHVTDPF